MSNKKLKIPNHVAIILDGNGRWAQERGLDRSKGHLAGYNNILDISIYILNKGTKYLSVYAFSTENFNRPQKEVDYLMNLFITGFNKDSHYFKEENIKVIFSGRRDNLRDDVRKGIEKLEEVTSDFKRGVLNICLNYGGRYEIVDMTKKIASLVKNNKIDISDINEEIVNKYMYQELPPLDFVIRTSGEERISNFMLWQGSYAEYYFPETLFPDFNEKEFDKALLEFQKRNRRFGG